MSPTLQLRVERGGRPCADDPIFKLQTIGGLSRFDYDVIAPWMQPFVWGRVASYRVMSHLL